MFSWASVYLFAQAPVMYLFAQASITYLFAQASITYLFAQAPVALLKLFTKGAYRSRLMICFMNILRL
jgi:hypothetical protein